MDYQGNFQDMIARYNRELMRTYQKQHAAEQGEAFPAAEGEPDAPVAKEASDVASAGGEGPVGEAAVEANDVSDVSFIARPSPIAEPTPFEQPVAVSMPPEVDTRPRYPLFEPQPRPESPADALRFANAPTEISESEPLAAAEGSAVVSPPMETAYLQVWVTTAQETLPVAGAHVTISQDDGDGQVVRFIGLTDRSGKTELVPLPAVSRQLSLVPNGSPTPYTTYNIEVYADGYYRIKNEGLPLYGGIKAVQPVRMIPLPEFASSDSTLVFPESGPSGLSGEEVGEE